MNILVRIAVAAIAAVSFTYAASAQLPGGSTPSADASVHSAALAACRHITRTSASKNGERPFINCLAQAEPQRYNHCRELSREYGNIDPHMWHMHSEVLQRCMVSERWRNLHLSEAAAIESGKSPRSVKP